MKIIWFKICIISISIVLLWTGCRRQVVFNTPEILTSETPILPTIRSTSTVQPTIPTQISTTTQQYTSTSTPVPTITPSPFPTLSQSERQLYLEEHLLTNNNCKLPCWLGITPGKTTWQEAKDFLTYLGTTKIIDIEEKNDEILHGVGGFDFEEPRMFHRFSIIEKDKYVKGIFLDVGGYYSPSEFTKIWKLYDPRNLVRDYGTPSKVWFDTLSISIAPRHGYNLIIAYDNLGIIVRYEGFLTEIGSSFRVCPRFEEDNDISSVEVYLQSPENPQPVEKLGGIGDWQWLFDRSKRIEEASGLSEEQFYELLAQTDHPACFYTPIDIWPEY